MKDTIPNHTTSRVSLNTPASFIQSEQEYVFIDIKNVSAHTVFDDRKNKVFVTAQMDFVQDGTGFPLFDLVPEEGLEITLVDQTGAEHDVSSRLITLPGDNPENKMRALSRSLEPGHYTLKFNYSPDFADTSFFSKWHDGGGVDFISTLSDSDPRYFVERFWPSNLEYDIYSQDLSLEVKNSKTQHSLWANGKVTKHHTNKFSIQFPEHFNCASPILSLSSDDLERAYGEFSYESIDGRTIALNIVGFPYEFHQLSAEDAVNGAKEILFQKLNEYENLLGPYPHDSFLVVTNRGSSMEYTAGTVSILGNLEHELVHQWFGRSVRPATGNDGWIDEAIVSWLSDTRGASAEPPAEFAELSYPKRPYARETHSGAYGSGAKLMEYFHHLYLEDGLDSGLFEVLSELFLKYRGQFLNNQEFLEHLLSHARTEESKLSIQQAYTRVVLSPSP